ncbi:MAG: phage major capsid protein [Bacteroidales bacterium]|nr:phage major capsid protein [Candidatus Scybalousia scybalohippi]
MEEFMKELDAMDLDQVKERRNEIEKSIRDAKSTEDIDGLDEKINAIITRIKELEDLEARKNAALALQNEEVAPTKVIEERKEEKKMAQVELRDSLEYGKAFVKAIISGDDTEARSLLTENVSGTLPVPTLLDTEIRNAWEETHLLSLCKQTSYPGNVKVGFEYSATGASVHVEGSAAPAEEQLVLGAVELKAESIKKWIRVSDEAIEGTTIDTLGYIYKELAQKIAEKGEEILIQKIDAAPSVSTTTAVAVASLDVDTLEEDTIVLALAELSAKAKDVNLAMNRRTYAAFKAIQKKAKYNVDVFDGLDSKVVFTDQLPAFNAAGAGDTYFIAGDFGYGAQVNKPKGNDMKIIVDDKSESEADLVKVVGKMYAGIGVVAPKAFVKLKKAD